MDEIVKLPEQDRIELFTETAGVMRMSPAVVEKDFWVVWVLGQLFESDLLADKILFKGGTSLSKVFGLIERFSEDIDLILNWTEVVTDSLQPLTPTPLPEGEGRLNHPSIFGRRAGDEGHRRARNEGFLKGN